MHFQTSQGNDFEKTSSQTSDQLAHVVTDQTDNEQQTVVSELEKQLEPIQQNLSEVKVDLSFDEEDNNAVKDEQSSETVDNANTEVGDLDASSDRKTRKRKSVEDKMERYKKFLKEDMRKRQKVVSNFDPENHIKDSIASGSKRADRNTSKCETGVNC